MTRREQLNQQRLGTLHDEFIPLVETFLQRLELMVTCHPLIVQARRSMEQQAALYAQGRTAPGKIVTNARPGRSFHEYGLAVDLVDLGASGDPDKYEQSDFDRTGYDGWKPLMPSGMRWGGAWTHPDRPHYEWAPGFASWEAVGLARFADETGRLPVRFFRERGYANA